MFHRVIQKITLAQFFLRHGVVTVYCAHMAVACSNVMHQVSVEGIDAVLGSLWRELPWLSRTQTTRLSPVSKLVTVHMYRVG